MRDYSGDLRESLGSDELFGLLASALRDAGPGSFHVCGTYLLESLARAEKGGLLVACELLTGETVTRVARATGLFPVALKQEEGSFHLSRPGERGITLVPLDGPDIRSHLARAGFTVLAMGLDVLGSGPPALVDPLGGLEDLERGLLRVSDPGAVDEEPARVLLGADLRRRFALEPDDAAMRAMKKGAHLLRLVPEPRAWNAMARLFMETGLSDTAAFLREAGAIEALLPEVAGIYEVPQNYYHRVGVWEHTLETLDRLDEMLADPRSHFKAYGSRIASYLTRRVGGTRRRALLAFGGLIHDAGKAATMTVEPSGRIRFQGHQLEGARLAEGIAGRLGLGSRARQHLVAIVRDHMRLGFLLKEGESTRTRLRAALDLSDHCVEVVMLSLADRLATRGEAATPEGLERFRRVSTRVLGDWFWLKDVPPLVDGRDIMVHSGLRQGPEVGRALFEARVAQRESTVANRQQALEFLAPDFKGKMDVRGNGPEAG